MNAMPLFSVFVFIVMIVLLPILYGEVLAARLGKLDDRHYHRRADQYPGQAHSA